MHRRSAVAVVVAVLALGIARCGGVAHAQQIFSGYYGYTPPRFPTANSFKGAFNMCRVMFTSNRREKRGWDTDYPGADINFSVRLGGADADARHEAAEPQRPGVRRRSSDGPGALPVPVRADGGRGHRDLQRSGSEAVPRVAS